MNGGKPAQAALYFVVDSVFAECRNIWPNIISRRCQLGLPAIPLGEQHHLWRSFASVFLSKSRRLLVLPQVKNRQLWIPSLPNSGLRRHLPWFACKFAYGTKPPGPAFRFHDHVQDAPICCATLSQRQTIQQPTGKTADSCFYFAGDGAQFSRRL